MLSEVVEYIEQGQRFAITSHVRPDGDSVGSSLALMLMLERLAKKVEVVMHDEIPRAYQGMPGAHRIRQIPQFDRPRQYDAVFVVECSDIDRPGLPGLEQQFTINIDHHATTVRFGDINWIDPTASAVGEMIFSLCKATGVRVTADIASCVYAALLTDTGSFHYPNTTSRALKVASELVKLGADPAQVSRTIYYSQPFSKLKLLGLALSSLTRDSSGRIACVAITQEMMKQAGASEEDAEGIVTYPLNVAEIDIVVSLREIEPRIYRASLRSKDSVNVARIADYFGGGGHRNAAGCTMVGALEEIESRLILKLQEVLNHVPGSHVPDSGLHSFDQAPVEG